MCSYCCVVIDTDAPSHVNRSVAAILASAEAEKKKKYNNVANAATYYLKHLSEHIRLKWGKSYGEVMGWLRASLTFAIIRATNLCLQGSRVKWRSALDMVDGIGLPSIQE